MYEGKPRTLFFRFAVPQMTGLLFNSVYTIVDGVFIGHRLGREAMAAAAVAVPLIEILISVAIAAGAGAGVLIAARLGAGDGAGARRLFNTAAWMLGGGRAAGVYAGQPVSGTAGPAAGGLRGGALPGLRLSVVHRHLCPLPVVQLPAGGDGPQ